MQTPVKLSKEDFKVKKKKSQSRKCHNAASLQQTQGKGSLIKETDSFTHGAIAFITVMRLLPIHVDLNSTLGACTPYPGNLAGARGHSLWEEHFT